MEYKVDGWNNFCRVFELPEEYPDGFLFEGGKPVPFLMVDWFNPVDTSRVPIAAVSKDVFREEVGEVKTENITDEELRETLIPFLVKKLYTKSGTDYLILCEFGASIIFTA